MAKFEKGKPRLPNAGKKKGYKNPLRNLREVCEEEGFCFSTEMIKLFKETENEMVKVQILRDGMRVLYPANVQLSGPNNESIKIEEQSSSDRAMVEELKALSKALRDGTA